MGLGAIRSYYLAMRAARFLMRVCHAFTPALRRLSGVLALDTWRICSLTSSNAAWSNFRMVVVRAAASFLNASNFVIIVLRASHCALRVASDK